MDLINKSISTRNKSAIINRSRKLYQKFISDIKEITPNTVLMLAQLLVIFRS